uniref:Transmembrane protein 14C n=1 Tax=Aceria tosichella TaxID=561515 RepID=A0A6G1SET9_9ACAR
MSESPSTTPSSTHATTITVFGATMPFDVFSATYAILVAAGGILGYAKAKSVPSLAAGLTFGALIGTGSYLEATQDNYWVTFAGSGLLGLMMTQRFLKSKKFMPAGLVSALSIGMVLRYSIRTYQLSREGSKP